MPRSFAAPLSIPNGQAACIPVAIAWSLNGNLLLAADVRHVRDARDLAVLVHADVLVVDRVVVFRQRVDHHLVHHAVPLVIDADALRVDDLNGGFGARLAGDGAEHT